MAHHNNHHIHIPCNDMNNQFLSRDCYRFTTARFDSSLVLGKITREEVECMLEKVDESVDHFKPTKQLFIWGTLAMCAFFVLYIVDMFSLIGSNSSMFVVLLIVSIVGGLAAFVVCMVCLCKTQRVYQRKIQELFDEENLSIWHARQIHWRVGPNLTYLHIMFNFDALNG